MKDTVLKKTITLRRKSLLMAVLFVLIMFSLLFTASCRDVDTTQKTEMGKDPGIHEKVERGPVTVLLDTDRKEINVAERLKLTITVISDEDYEIELPGFGEKLEQFGIVDYHTTLPELVDNSKKKVSRSYVLEPFLSGDYKIPPMEVGFRNNAGQDKADHKIETPELNIRVTSLLPDDLKKLKLNDIMPPVPFPSSKTIWIWLGIGLVIAVAGGVCVWLYVCKRKRVAEENGKVIPVHEIAYEELKRLIDEDLVEKGEIKLFYQRISGILRRYIENRFGLRAPEQTTEEFLTGMETSPDFPDIYRPLLKSFMSHCDLVKFAEHVPVAEEIQKTFDSCKSFIEGTEERN